MNLYEVLRRPLTTEKTYQGFEQGRYVFEVHPEANKHQVKEAVEKLFEVHVDWVNIVNLPAKRRRVGRRWMVRQPAKKKAIVQLAKGERISSLEAASA